ncbi:MAG: UDP-N-acetylmuramate dehydrogenase [Ferruginibacter sp.]
MIQQNISLKKFNTFGVDVYAKQFSTFQSVEELQEILQNLKPQTSNLKPQTSNLKPHTSNLKSQTYILGGGSNILFTKNIDGTVLKNEITGIEKINEDAEYVFIRAGAGENWHVFVEYCLNNNYAGVENLALIPGNVGASPMQNIGAYGVEIKDVFESLEAFDMEKNELKTFHKADCGFGYRESVFKNKYKGRFIITSVTFRLLKKPVFNTSYGAIEEELEKMNAGITIQNIAQAVINIRTSKLPDPKVIGNAGSFFKNPEISNELHQNLKNKFPGIIGYDLSNGNVKLAAGWLIEQCGWKGYRKGDAGCHSKQALVLVNYGNASGNDIIEMSTRIIESVDKRFGLLLEREVNVIPPHHPSPI